MSTSNSINERMIDAAINQNNQLDKNIYVTGCASHSFLESRDDIQAKHKKDRFSNRESQPIKKNHVGSFACEDDVFFDHTDRHKLNKGNVFLWSLIKMRRKKFRRSHQHPSYQDTKVLIDSIISQMKFKKPPSRFITWSRTLQSWELLDYSNLEYRIFLMTFSDYAKCYDYTGSDVSATTDEHFNLNSTGTQYREIGLMWENKTITSHSQEVRLTGRKDNICDKDAIGSHGILELKNCKEPVPIKVSEEISDDLRDSNFNNQNVLVLETSYDGVEVSITKYPNDNAANKGFKVKGAIICCNQSFSCADNKHGRIKKVELHERISNIPRDLDFGDQKTSTLDKKTELCAINGTYDNITYKGFETNSMNTGFEITHIQSEEMRRIASWFVPEGENAINNKEFVLDQTTLINDHKELSSKKHGLKDRKIDHHVNSGMKYQHILLPDDNTEVSSANFQNGHFSNIRFEITEVKKKFVQYSQYYIHKNSSMNTLNKNSQQVLMNFAEKFTGTFIPIFESSYFEEIFLNPHSSTYQCLLQIETNISNNIKEFEKFSVICYCNDINNQIQLRSFSALHSISNKNKMKQIICSSQITNKHCALINAHVKRELGTELINTMNAGILIMLWSLEVFFQEHAKRCHVLESINWSFLSSLQTPLLLDNENIEKYPEHAIYNENNESNKYAKEKNCEELIHMIKKSLPLPKTVACEDDILFDHIYRHKFQRGNIFLLSLIQIKRKSFNKEKIIHEMKKCVIHSIITKMKCKEPPSKFLTWDESSSIWINVEGCDLEQRVILLLRGFTVECYDDDDFNVSKLASRYIDVADLMPPHNCQKKKQQQRPYNTNFKNKNLNLKMKNLCHQYKHHQSLSYDTSFKDFSIQECISETDDNGCFLTCNTTYYSDDEIYSQSNTQYKNTEQYHLSDGIKENEWKTNNSSLGGKSRNNNIFIQPFGLAIFQSSCIKEDISWDGSSKCDRKHVSYDSCSNNNSSMNTEIITHRENDSEIGTTSTWFDFILGMSKEESKDESYENKIMKNIFQISTYDTFATNSNESLTSTVMEDMLSDEDDSSFMPINEVTCTTSCDESLEFTDETSISFNEDYRGFASDNYLNECHSLSTRSKVLVNELKEELVQRSELYSSYCSFCPFNIEYKEEIDELNYVEPSEPTEEMTSMSSSEDSAGSVSGGSLDTCVPPAIPNVETEILSEELYGRTKLPIACTKGSHQNTHNLDILLDNYVRHCTNQGNIDLQALVDFYKKSFDACKDSVESMGIVCSVINTVRCTDKNGVPARFLILDLRNLHWIELDEDDVKARILMFFLGFKEDIYNE